MIDRDDLAKLHVRQRARRDARLQGLRHRRALRGARGRARRARRPRRAARRCAGPSKRCGAGSRRPSPRAPTSSCCRTATPTPTGRPFPSLLLTAAVHHHLVREKTRTKVGLVIETGDAREVHHMALLIGFGAAAVNPYLALDSIDDMISEGLLEGVSPRQARRNYMKAACKGVLKVMSKMGISTVASYTGAQVFEAIGLDGARRSTSTSPGLRPHRRRRARGAGGRGGDAPPAGPRGAADRAGPPRARGGRGVPVAARGRIPPLQPQDGVQAAARHAGQALRRSSRSTRRRSTTSPRSSARCAGCCG